MAVDEASERRLRVELGDPNDFYEKQRRLSRLARSGKVFTYLTWEEVAKNDFNISPSRYIHTGRANEYDSCPRSSKNPTHWNKKPRKQTRP